MKHSRANLAATALIVWAAAFSVEASRAGMVHLPAGNYTPFQRLQTSNASAPAPPNVVTIGAFWLDVEPVTNAEFLDFVTAYPEWRRSRIKPLFADHLYLGRWSGDLALADAEARDEPVTNVSWFAAEAYCRVRGARLPTTNQWEYAIADNGRDREGVRERSLKWFAEPNPARPPAIGGPANGFGVKDLVGLVWEWTLDFDAYATDSVLVCSGAAAGATDPTDYPGFMRFSLRASLKPNYTADNVGFRCAAGAS